MAKPSGNGYLKVAQAMAKTSTAPQRNRAIKMARPYAYAYADILPQPDYSYAMRITRQTPKSAIRGEYNALFLAATYHDVELHQRLRPLNASSARAFDALERIRLEYLGLIYEQERFPKLLDELDSTFEIRHNSFGWFTRTLSPAVAVEQFARSVILKGRPYYTPSTGRFNKWLWRHREENFGRRFNRLLFTLTDQSAFAGTALRVLEESGFSISHKERGEAEEELQIALGRNPSMKDDLQKAARKETEDAATDSDNNVKIEKNGTWARPIFRVLDAAAFKIQNRVSGVTDFVFGGIGRSLKKAYLGFKELVSSDTFTGLVALVIIPVMLFYALPKLIMEIIKDPAGMARTIATIGTVLLTYLTLKQGLSKDSRRKMRLYIRRMKNRHLPWYLRPKLWRAQTLMHELASTQFNHFADPMTRQMAAQSSMAASYAAYQRQEDGWVDLQSLPTHDTGSKHYRDFSAALAQVCHGYKRELDEIKPAKLKENTDTRPVYAMLDGEALDPHSLPDIIINPAEEPLHMGIRTDVRKKNRFTVTLALCPSVFEMRAMPEIYTLCAALEKKGYNTEVIALFSEAKTPFTSGYGRAQPLKRVHIKKAATPLRRATAAFAHAHNVIMPQGHVMGESALTAMNHARSRFGKDAIGVYIGDESYDSKHRTFRGRIRKVHKVLEVFDFDRRAMSDMDKALKAKQSYFGTLLFRRKDDISAHRLGHALIKRLKYIMDKHPSCG